MDGRISTTKVFIGLDTGELAAFVGRAKAKGCSHICIEYDRIDTGCDPVIGNNFIIHEVILRAKLGPWKVSQKWTSAAKRDPREDYDYLSTPHSSWHNPVRLRGTMMWGVDDPIQAQDWTYVSFPGMIHVRDESVKAMRIGMR